MRGGRTGVEGELIAGVGENWACVGIGSGLRDEASAVGWRVKLGERRMFFVAVGLLAIVTGVWMLMREDERQVEIAAQEPVEERDGSARADAEQVEARSGEIHDDAFVGDGPVDRNEARPEAGDGEQPLEQALRSVVEANAAELQLEPAEVDQLVGQYLEFQEVHSELASRFVEERSYQPNRVELRVPAFPVEGKALRELFYARVRESLPEEKAGRVVEQLGQYFEGAFHGFGAAEMQLTVTRNPGAEETFDVEWSATVPEGGSISTELADVHYGGSSGNFRLSREQLTTGEFRFLNGVVGARFPE